MATSFYHADVDPVVGDEAADGALVGHRIARQEGLLGDGLEPRDVWEHHAACHAGRPVGPVVDILVLLILGWEKRRYDHGYFPRHFCQVRNNLANLMDYGNVRVSP